MLVAALTFNVVRDLEGLIFGGVLVGVRVVLVDLLAVVEMLRFPGGGNLASQKPFAPWT